MKNKSKYYFRTIEQRKLFINPNGDLRIEFLMMLKLMNTTGVFHLKNKEDLWILSYRTYIVFGMYISFELLLMDEVFFRVHTDRYDNELDFTDFMLKTIKDGIKRTVSTSELVDYIGVKSKEKCNVSNAKFENKMILKAKNFWLHDKDLILFPGTPRNRYLRKKLLKGNSVPKKRKKEAEKWADLVTKYL